MYYMSDITIKLYGKSIQTNDTCNLVCVHKFNALGDLVRNHHTVIKIDNCTCTYLALFFAIFKGVSIEMVRNH